MLCPHCQSEVDPTAVYCIRCGQTVSGDEPERDYLYEAFISYRHTPHDQRVARRIQRAIEGRTIPKGLRETAGRARLGKCFRDEDELPTDASLSTMITDALERSRWLIVVCSPAMRESRWCAQEVKTFCELHGRDRVLLALSAGEPDEAFPLILQSRAEVLPDGTVVEEPFEPIAADLREGTGKRFTAEALRLVAPLMGCGYDDLRQRERMRRARLISSVAAVIAAVSVAFGAFSYSQQLQIDANYQASLRNQSAYLATESADLLLMGDRMQAAQVAYAALPVGDHTSRPYVPAAQMALADALQVYPMDDQWHPCYSRLFNEGLYLHDVVTAPNGSRCAASDSDGILYVWDTASGELMRIEAPAHQTDFITVSDPCFRGDELVCSYDSLLVRYDLETGEVLESVDVEGLYDKSQWPMFTGEYNALAVSEDGRLAALAGNYQFDDTSVIVYDLQSGQLVQAVHYAVPEEAEVDVLVDKHVVSFDSDGSHLIVAQGTFVVSVDIATGKVTTLVSEFGSVSNLQVADDAVVIGFCKAADDERQVFDTSVRALDPATLKERWAYRLDGQEYYYHGAANLTSRTKYPLPAFHGMVDLEDARRLLVTIGGTAHLLDPETGASDYDCDVEKHLVGAGLARIAHVNGYGYENGLYLVLATVDGQIITHSLDRDFDIAADSGHRTDTGDITLNQARMFSCEGTPYLVTKSGSQNGHVVIWRCDHLQELPGYEELADSVGTSITRSVDGTYLAPDTWYDSNGDAVRVFDATTLSAGAALSPSDEATSAVLCFSDAYDDVLYAIESNFETSTLRSYDAATGECVGEVRGILTKPLDLSECEEILRSYSDRLHLLCVEEDDDGHEHVVLRTVDARTLEEQASQELDMGDEYFSTIGLDVTAATSDLFACEQSNQLKVWSLADGSQLDCDLAQTALRDDYLMMANPDGSAILVASGGVLRCYGTSGSLQWERPFRMRYEGYLAYAPDGRIVCEDGSGELMLVDAATGEIITSDLTSYYLKGISWFSADGNRLYAQAREATDTSGFRSLLVIRLDPDEFGVETAAYYANAMTPDAKRFICSTNEETYTLPCWSLEDLAARAEEITSGHELTEAEQRLYHLQ